MAHAILETASMAEPGAPIITIDELVVAYGARRAVDGLSLTVPEGSILGFLGPNGAGKTSTIKTMLGFRRPDSGRITIFGHDSYRDSLHIRTRAGYVSELNSLYEGLTISQLCRFCRQTARSWDQATVNRYMTLFGLPASSIVSQLSKGMKPQLALSLAMGSNPDLLILDEPTAGLDPLARHTFLNTLVSDIAASGKTIFFSSHILSEVEAIADRVAIINKGRLAICDDLDHIRQTHTVFKLSFDALPTAEDLASIRRYPGVMQSIQEGRSVRIYRRGAADSFLPQMLAELTHVRHVDTLKLSLEDIFLAYVKEQSLDH